jgi:hypothetical protein
MSEMIPNVRYQLTVRYKIDGKWRRLSGDFHRYNKKIFDVKTSLDATNDKLITDMNEFDNRVSIVAYIGTLKWYLKPIPENPDVHQLVFKNSIDINCMTKVLSRIYPNLADVIEEWGHFMRKTGKETVQDLQPLLNEIKRNATFLTIDGHEICRLKARRSAGNSNARIYCFDGHAFTEDLTFDEPDPSQHLLVPSHEIYDRLMNEPQTVCIKLLGDGCGYRTYDGRVVMAEERYKELMELSDKYVVDVPLTCTSPLSVYFKFWIRLNDFLPTKMYVNEIRMATMECIKYNVEDLSMNELQHVDLNSAFKSITETHHPAHKYYEKYLIPQSCTFYIHNPTFQQVVSVSGFVYASIQWSSNIHPYFKNLLQNHGKWFTTPMIAFSQSCGWIVSATYHKLIWGNERRSVHWGDLDNKTARQLVGKTWQSGLTDTYHVKDEQFRDFLINKFEAEGTLHKWSPATVSATRPPGKQYLEVRSFVLTYHIIGMIATVSKYGDNVVGVGCDDIWLKDLSKFNEPFSKKPGHWKIEPSTFKYQDYADPELSKSDSTPTEYVDNDPQVLVDDDIIWQCITSPVSHLKGALGRGKTHGIANYLKQLPRDRYVYLTPNKGLARDKTEEYDGLNAVNWHRYFGTSCLKDWKKIITRGYTARFVVWDEIYTVCAEEILGFCNYLKGLGTTLLLVGDDGQLKPFDGRDNVGAVSEILGDGFQYEYTKDYRSLDEKSEKLKDSLRYQKEEECVRLILEAVGSTAHKKMLKEWTPTSLVFASTRIMGAFYTRILKEQQKKKFPKHDIPYLFTDTTVHEGKTYYCGDRIMLSPKAKPPNNTRLGYVYTIHSCIGKTLLDKLFIIEDRNSSVWCQGGLYTCVGRIRRINQLYFVKPPPEALEHCRTVDSPLIDQIEKRIINHKKADQRADRMEGDYIDTEYIQCLCESTPNCTVCNRELEYNNYKQFSSEVWSIDRLDNKKGHIKGNVRITCHSCNIHKKS